MQKSSQFPKTLCITNKSNQRQYRILFLSIIIAIFIMPGSQSCSNEDGNKQNYNSKQELVTRKRSDGTISSKTQVDEFGNKRRRFNTTPRKFNDLGSTIRPHSSLHSRQAA